MAKYKYPKREIESIELRMAEGKMGHMGLVKIEASPYDGDKIAFRMADAAIKTWAKDTDKHLRGYRKLDFILKWVDGETYSGTFLLSPGHARGSKYLERHVKEHIKALLKMYSEGVGRVSPETARLAKKILKSYQLS